MNQKSKNKALWSSLSMALGITLCLAVPRTGVAAPHLGPGPKVAGSMPQVSHHGQQGTGTVLKVKLYPWIPDINADGFASIAARMETEFKLENPDVDLEINPSCFEGDVYDVPYVISALKGEQPDCATDIVEVDMLTLGDLVDAGAARPWPNLPRQNWHPASIMASTYHGAVYGIPHWMCTHFVFSRNVGAVRARSAEQLVDALENLNTPAINLTGHFLLNWNTNALYLDAWADSHRGDPASAISASQLDSGVLDAFRSIADQCNFAGSNRCLDGTWEDFALFDYPVELFAKGEADATVGYLEVLNRIAAYLPAGTSLEQTGILFNTLPLGKRNVPVMFTDSFVLSSRCVGRCADAARRFAVYVSRTETMEWLVSGQDVPEPNRMPRYSLVANRDTYKSPALIGNPIFARADALTRNARVAFPNSGFYPVLDPMYELILQGLTY
jgi:thiamine pyridinylase